MHAVMNPPKGTSSKDARQDLGVRIDPPFTSNTNSADVPGGFLASVLSFIAGPLSFPSTSQSNETDPEWDDHSSSCDAPHCELAGETSSRDENRNAWTHKAWLTVDDVKLLTQPSSVPVPSRKPPPPPTLKAACRDEDCPKNSDIQLLASTSASTSPSSSSSAVKPSTNQIEPKVSQPDVVVVDIPLSTPVPVTSSPQTDRDGTPFASPENSRTATTMPTADDWTSVLDAALNNSQPTSSDSAPNTTPTRDPQRAPANTAAKTKPRALQDPHPQTGFDSAARAAKEAEIRKWAAGKVGNLRALLSSLHLVLWSECGWRAVSLPELITPAAVKKAYRAALLHVHPDKIQRVGASAQQKYIAESVFNLLNEAFRKFDTQELH